MPSPYRAGMAWGLWSPTRAALGYVLERTSPRLGNTCNVYEHDMRCLCSRSRIQALVDMLGTHSRSPPCASCILLCMFRLRYESHQHHLNARRMHAVGARSDEIDLFGSVRIFILSQPPPFGAVLAFSRCIIYFLLRHLGDLYPYAPHARDFLFLICPVAYGYSAAAVCTIFLVCSRLRAPFLRPLCVPFFLCYVLRVCPT